jgi:hypothetical protein
MRRTILCIAALAAVVASCSSGTDIDSSSAPVEVPSTDVAQSGVDGTTTSTTNAASSTVDGTTAPPDTAVPIDGPPAPDFRLALGDGGEFTLSAEQKPVYLVFWAEW